MSSAFRGIGFGREVLPIPPLQLRWRAVQHRWVRHSRLLLLGRCQTLHERHEHVDAVRVERRAAADGRDRRVGGYGSGPMLTITSSLGETHRVSCFKVIPQLATECFGWRLCAISCITGVTVMEEML